MFRTHRNKIFNPNPINPQAVIGCWTHLILRTDRVLLDMADTSLTSLSDDLKDRLSLIWRQTEDRWTGEQMYDITNEVCIVPCDIFKCVHLWWILHHTCRHKRRVSLLQHSDVRVLVVRIDDVIVLVGFRFNTLTSDVTDSCDVFKYVPAHVHRKCDITLKNNQSSETRGGTTKQINGLASNRNQSLQCQKDGSLLTWLDHHGNRRCTPDLQVQSFSLKSC